MMTTFAIVVFGLAVLILAMRQWLLHREVTIAAGEDFDGVVYRVGGAAVAERRCFDGIASAEEPVEKPAATVICMHGFVENMGYFTHFYRQRNIQLILLTSCGYHVPIANPRYRDAPWAKTPDAAEGTIEYDAMVLNQALEALPRGESIRVHGHSRGGAVVLEAAAMRPDLFEKVEVILEAPVLPQARTYSKMSQTQLWFLSFLVPLWRRRPIGPHNRAAWGPLDNERKRMLIEGLPFNPKRVSIMVTNMRSMGKWMESRPVSLYQNLQHGLILVPEKDRVLDAKSMAESAAQGVHGDLRLVKIEQCSHFPLFDRPEVIPPPGACLHTNAAHPEAVQTA